MIKIKSIGSRATATGEEVTGAASSNAITGPKDKLKNAYNYLDSKIATAKGAADGGLGFTQSEGFKEFTGGLREGYEAASGRSIDDLWNNIMCPPEQRGERGRRNLGSRLDTSSMWMRSSNCTVDALVESIQVNDGGKLHIEPEVLRNRLKDSVRVPFNDLDATTEDMLIAAMANATGHGEGSVEVWLGTGKAILNPETYQDARSLTTLLSAVSGNTELAKYIDMQAEMAVLNVILDKSIELGVPDAIDQVLAKIEDEQAARRFLLQRIRQAAEQSDLRTVQKAVEYVGADGVLARVPDLIEVILSHYQLPRGDNVPTHLESYTLLNETLTMVKAEWYLTRRGEEIAHNLTPFQQASQDAVLLFEKYSEKVADILVGQGVRDMSQHAALSYFYPRMLIL